MAPWGRQLLSTVDAIKSLLADAYVHLNSHAPPNKLPHELLIMIFQHALSSYTPISFPAIKHDVYIPILHTLKEIAQVCRLWRDIAFGTPTLWTCIDSRACPADELCHLVQRSAPCPLSLFLNNAACEGVVQAYSELLRSISSRLLRVDIDMVKPALPAIEDLLSFDGSTLRCLTMSSPTFETGRRSLNSSILQGQVGSLQALAIAPFFGWIPANHFPRLTHLYISFDASASPPYPESISTLLCNTPFVEIVHFHGLTTLGGEVLSEPSEPLRVKLPRLRSLVFTISVYHLVVDILYGLSIPPSALIRLDNLFVPYNREASPPIPSHLSPLGNVTAMQLTVKDETLFLVAEDASSGLWLKACREDDLTWDNWLLDLPAMLPLKNLVSLYAEVYNPVALGVIRDMAQLSELSVRLSLSPDRLDAATDTDSRVLWLCTLLEQSQPVVCPSLRSLTLEWPEHVPTSRSLQVPKILAMLSTRSRLGHPIRRLVVQTAATERGSVRALRFLEQLAPLAGHVEEYEACVDAKADTCSLEMRDMWNVEGAEDYWALDETQRPRYRGCQRSYDYWYL